MSVDRLVLVTRPRGVADPLVGLLEQRGFRVAAEPTVTTLPLPDGGRLDAALNDAAGWDWIVLTSAAGVSAVGDAMTRSGLLPDTQPTTRWAAVGPATAAALRDLGVEASLVAAELTGVGLGRALTAAAPPSAGLHGSRILLPRGEAASPDLPDALRAAGADVVEVIAYRTVEGPLELLAGIVEALKDDALCAIVVASGSAVRGLIALAERGGMAQRISAVPLVSIGPSTSATARAAGLRWVAEAHQPTPESLAEALDVVLNAPRDAVVTTTTARIEPSPALSRRTR